MAITPSTETTRLVSLDAFRGAVIALMVLVNNGGGPESFAQLQHSKWHGWTITDFVFPSFLWMVGISITLSLGKRMRAGIPKAVLLRQILRRALILIALGLLVYLFPEFRFATMRFPGVLQRIGICYFAASCIYLTSGLRGQLFWIAGLLFVYWTLMTFFPVPAYGAGRYDLEGNFAHFVDRILFGVHNYHAGDWDPEGSISTLPAVATTLFGIMAGHLLRWDEKLSKKLVAMMIIGAALVIAGLIWNFWMPINKKLWTGSFSLFNAGLDSIVFACFAWIVDGAGMQLPVRPLVIFGMNAIAVYMAAELLASTLDWLDIHDWIFQHALAPIASPKIASLLYATGFVVAMYGVAYALYRRNWFWRI